VSVLFLFYPKGRLLEKPLEKVLGGINLRSAKLKGRRKLGKTLEKYREENKNGRD